MEHLFKIFFALRWVIALRLSEFFAFQPSQWRFMPFFPLLMFYVEQCKKLINIGFSWQRALVIPPHLRVLTFKA